MVGGGVRGKDAGIAHGTIAQAGDTMRVSHLFMEGCLPDGERIIGNIVGMGENGIISEYLIRNFNESIKGMFVNNLDHNLKLGHSKPDRNPR